MLKVVNNIAIIEPVGGHGGMEIYDFGVCSALAENGCDITLYTCDKTKGYDLESRFVIKRYFKKIYSKSNIILRLFMFVRGVIKTFFDISKEKPDLIYLHVFTFSAVELLVVLMSIVTRSRRIFINVHDPISFGNKESGVIKLLFGYLFLFKKIVVTTHSKYSVLTLAKLFPELKVELMPHSDIDFIYDEHEESVVCKRKLGLDENIQYVLFFGQIKKTKGLECLLRAWAELISMDSVAMLVIVGRCWKNDCLKYKDLIKELGISKNIIWNEKYIEDEVVPLYFRSSDLVVLPYTRIYSSGVLLRAMGYGTAVVVSDQPAFTEVIEKGVSGVVFETENHNDLATKLMSILSDDSNRKRIAKNASIVMNSNRSWNVVGKEMLSIFRVGDNVEIK